VVVRQTRIIAAPPESKNTPWFTAILFFFLLLLCVNNWGCSSVPSGDLTLDAHCAEHTCDFDPLSFDPEPEALRITEIALDNINERTGAGLTISDDGMKVAVQSVVIGNAGAPVCGVTFTALDVDSGERVSVDIFIATEHVDGCTPQWAVLRHEMACHAMAPGAEHTANGVCSPYGSGDVEFDDESAALMKLP
jgi:hypothetical protein